MNTPAVTLHVPLSLYELLLKRAKEASQSVEDEILEVVESVVRPGEGDLSPDLQAAIDPLSGLDDGALRRAALDRSPEQAATRFAELNDKQQREGLTAEELEALQDLRHGYERVMVIRAEAASLLAQRGNDVTALADPS